MPKKVAQPEFRQSGSKVHVDPAWLNGDCLLLEKGTDFDVEVRKMAAAVKKAGRKAGKAVAISTKDANGDKITDGLIIKARDASDAEKAEWDRKRAERKKLAKAKRALRKAASANGNGGTTPAPTPAQTGHKPQHGRKN